MRVLYNQNNGQLIARKSVSCPILKRVGNRKFFSLSLIGGEGWGEGAGHVNSIHGLTFSQSSGNTGFSLLEVMCAILVLGIALTGLTMGLSTALTSSKESELQTTAAMIAEGQIEMLRAGGTIVDGEDEGGFTGGLSLYKWKQTIKETEIRGLHDVTVEVENSKTSAPIYELKTMLFSTPTEPDDQGPGKQKEKDTSKKRRRRGA